ncbi:NAD(P)H-dependent oxidoreductase [Pelagibaculum spongiae]|uniref:NAD(P)H-dependent oxidoreductase n=1 Tax=Pelagibaculum spongiae TaxID=2080658 RepID=UPI0013145632|nr:NAD(P)H-dependent oxidoreductase [Pelagibaculum spongiae]
MNGATQLRVLVVIAHPDPDSLCQAAKTTACQALLQQGHQVKELDLYKNGFDPSLPLDAYKKHYTPDNITPVAEEVAQLQWAQALVVIYPVWWMSAPAIFKGWLDRVWLPEIASTFTDSGTIVPLLTEIKKIVFINTYGASWWRMALIGNPGRFFITLTMRACTSWFVSIKTVSLYSAVAAGEKRGKAFLNRISDAMKNF